MLNFENKWLRPMMTLAPDDGGGSATPSGGDGGGNGTSVTPAPSPASTDGGGGTVGGAAPAEPAATPAAGPDWSQLGSTDDLDYLSIPAEPPPPPTEPVVPPVPPEQPLQPPPVQPPPVPPAPPPTAAQPPEGTGDARPLTASDPWRIAEGLEANRDAVIPHLAATKFALSEEDLRELDADPGAAIPKMLARAFFESQVSMQKFLAQAVPGMIKNYNTVVKANDGAEEQFFKTHKALDVSNPQHREVAARIATVYRKANPGISLDQLIQEVGPMVMASLRIPQGTTTAPTAPAPAAQLPRGGTSFRPAVNGGGGAPIATEPANPWSGLGTNYD